MVIIAKEIKDSISECEALTAEIDRIRWKSNCARHSLYHKRNSETLTHEEEQLVEVMEKHEDNLTNEVNYP